MRQVCADKSKPHETAAWGRSVRTAAWKVPSPTTRTTQEVATGLLSEARWEKLQLPHLRMTRDSCSLRPHKRLGSKGSRRCGAGGGY